MQTQLAAALAPPSKHPGIQPVIVVLGSIAVIAEAGMTDSSIMAIIALAALGCWLYKKRQEYNEYDGAVYAAANAEWDRTYLCQRCGTTFLGPK